MSNGKLSVPLARASQFQVSSVGNLSSFGLWGVAPMPSHRWSLVVQNDAVPVHFLEYRLVAATSIVWYVSGRSAGALTALRTLNADPTSDAGYV
jgi:hypothetical protein